MVWKHCFGRARIKEGVIEEARSSLMRLSWTQQTFLSREQGRWPFSTRGVQQGFLGVRSAITDLLPVYAGPAFHPRLLLSHCIVLKMSFLKDSSVNMV